MRRRVPAAVSPADPAARWWRSAPLIAGLLFAFALVLRLHGLGGKPFWLDEVTTLRRSSLGLVALARDSLSFHHLPLFFALTAPFTRLGLDPVSMRLSAALFGALSCAILFGLGRYVAGPRAGIAAALLLAVAPFQVQYAQEARSYTLVTCFILLGLWGLIRLARAPRSDRVAWLLYGAGTALALDTLSVALFWFAAAQICAVLIARNTASRGFIRTWLLVNALVLAAYLPFILVMVRLTRGDMGSGLDWIPATSWHHVSVILQSVYMLRDSSLIAFRLFRGPLDLFNVPWLGIFVLVLAMLGVLSASRSVSGLCIIIACAALPVGVALASLRSSLWMPRYLLWSGPVLFLLAGLGAARLPPRLGRILPLPILLLGLVNLAPYYRTESKPLWNVTAATLRAAWRPGDLVLTDDPATIAMMNVTLDPRSAVSGHAERDGFTPGEWTTNPDVAIAAAHDGRRLWLVHGRVGQNDPYRLDALLNKVSVLPAPEEMRRIGLDITLLRIDPPASG